MYISKQLRCTRNDTEKLRLFWMLYQNNEITNHYGYIICIMYIHNQFTSHNSILLLHHQQNKATITIPTKKKQAHVGHHYTDASKWGYGAPVKLLELTTLTMLIKIKIQCNYYYSHMANSHMANSQNHNISL